MNANITKAEILWTRVCPLNCSYCSMATGERNSRAANEWIIGIEQLKKLGCKFIAFYGAEPLADFDNLPQVVGAAEEMGIDTTVITSGIVPNFKAKLRALYHSGAKSISMSYDMNPVNESSKNKSEAAIDGLLYFKSLGDVRDVAAITTITRKNYKQLPDLIKKMSSNDIWTFLDIVHPDLGHPGSKCRGGINGLSFDTKKQIDKLIGVLDQVLYMKSQGYLCHTTANFVNTLRKTRSYLYTWCCADHKEFPSWVTINPNGTVQPCDDFQLEWMKGEMTTLKDAWEILSDKWKRVILNHKCTCCWNTHIDSHAVKKGDLTINSYVHGRK